MGHDTLTIAEARGYFPQSQAGSYLSTCARGLLPVPSRAAIDAHLDALEAGSIDKDGLFQSVERVRDSFAQLVGCDADEIAFTKNVSEGLNIVAAALEWQAGDNVVVCLELEHPNNVYPWLNLRARAGVQVRAVAPRDGHVDIERVIRSIDHRTRLVTLPSVTFAPGFRADVAAVGRYCRERGVFTLVDAVQSVGILDTKVQQLSIDGLAVSTQKGLCGLYGMGMLYCRRHWADRLRPAYLARFGVDLGMDANEASLGGDNYQLAVGARRFDVGNYNYPGVVAAEQSLSILNAVTTTAIERHVMSLSRQLIDGLLELDVTVAGGECGEHTANIVCIGEPGAGHDRSDDPFINTLSEQLSAGGVKHTIRRGMIRMAFHLYNDETDVQRVLQLVAENR